MKPLWRICKKSLERRLKQAEYLAILFTISIQNYVAGIQMKKTERRLLLLQVDVVSFTLSNFLWSINKRKWLISKVLSNSTRSNEFNCVLKFLKTLAFFGKESIFYELESESIKKWKIFRSNIFLAMWFCLFWFIASFT